MKHNLINVSPLQLFTGELDRLFDLDSAFTPHTAVDLVRSEDSVTVEALLPGVAKKDVELSFEDGWLTIKGTVAEPQRSADSRIHLQEIARGEFSKRIRIGRDVDAASAQATVENGVLRITMKVAESAKPRRIGIK